MDEWSSETEFDEFEEDRFKSGVTAALSLVDRILVSPTVAEWSLGNYLTLSQAALRQHLAARPALQNQILINLMLARRRLDNTKTEEDSGNLRASIGSIIMALLLLSDRRSFATPTRLRMFDTAKSLANGIKLAPQLKKGIQQRESRYKATFPESLDRALGISEPEFENIKRQILRALNPDLVHDLRALPRGTEFGITQSAADLLGETQSFDPTETELTPEYDVHESGLHVAGITISDFRGVSSTMSLSLLKNGKASSTLIYGDNGTGKSTFVDAIEMALQKRVGRNSNFGSSMHPAIPSLATNRTPTVKVELSNGTSLSRTVIERASGGLIADGQPPSPGFRLAPISLKRSDILRFLDTDALSRGTIFFDYFPADAQKMAQRPDEQLESLRDEQFTLRVKRKTLTKRLADRVGVDANDIATVDSLAKFVKQNLLHGESPQKAIESGTWNSVESDIRDLVVDLRTTHTTLRRITKTLDRGIEVLNPIAYSRQARKLRTVLRNIGTELTESFLAITDVDYVRSINVYVGESGPVSLDIVVELTNGQRCFPQQIFSEGYRDLFAMLFFLSVAKEAARRGQAKVLILDDVFQSVDASIRFGVMKHVLENFSDWQLIITLHDRMWLEQLRNLFRRKSHQFIEHRILNWNFIDGPEFGSTTPDSAQSLQSALGNGDTAAVCSATGRLLEQCCTELSGRLRISIHRAPDDKYTLGDLWPGVMKAIKRTSLAALAANIDDRLELRNLVGAHYNHWAESLSWSDAQKFGMAAAKFYQSTFCNSCQEWLTLAADKSIQCPCAALSY